jgi:hypothetical protein
MRELIAICATIFIMFAAIFFIKRMSENQRLVFKKSEVKIIEEVVDAAKSPIISF